MTFSEIFSNYYTLYRGDDEVPATTDPEYTVALRLANTAVSRWEHVDDTYWAELYTTLQQAADGAKTTTAGTKTYSCPTNMREAGGFVKLLDGTSLKTTIPIVSTEQAQFYDSNTSFAYFTGNPQAGFTLNLNVAPSETGLNIDYVYYKKASTFTTGNDETEMQNDWFVIHHMLANRFRASRNWSAYQTALRDAEEALKNMQQHNFSGTWTNPVSLQDNSGTTWGV